MRPLYRKSKMFQHEMIRGLKSTGFVPYDSSTDHGYKLYSMDDYWQLEIYRDNALNLINPKIREFVPKINIRNLAYKSGYVQYDIYKIIPFMVYTLASDYCEDNMMYYLGLESQKLQKEIVFGYKTDHWEIRNNVGLVLAKTKEPNNLVYLVYLIERSFTLVGEFDIEHIEYYINRYMINL